MIPTVEIFYSFQCPYCYLAIDRLSQIETNFNVRVVWQPFSAKAAGKNFSPSPYPPDRASYIREDIVRIANKMQMPLIVRPNWPEEEFDPDKSIRGALVASDMERMLEYNIKMFYRWWGEAEDPNDPAFFIQLCDELDVDPNDFSGKMNTTDVRERVKGIYKRGKKLQVFDTPTIVIGEERFCGIERIEYAEERIKQLEATVPLVA